MLLYAVIWSAILGSHVQYANTQYDAILQDDGYRLVTGNSSCLVTINQTSSIYLRHALEVYRPNFARLNIKFRYQPNRTFEQHGTNYGYLEPSTSFTEYAIQPYEWIWTYYDPDSFFPYLKWPYDFAIASFNLLGSKTLKKEMYIVFEVHDMDCYITIGQQNTTEALAKALRNLTRDYLADLDKDKYDYSYWCFRSVVPGANETTSYQLGIYLGFPVEYVRYNCCRTYALKSVNLSLSIQCRDKQISEMWQCNVLPYILGVLATAFFPLALFKLCASFKIHRPKSNSKYERSVSLSQTANDWDMFPDVYDDWIFLDGHTPLNFIYLLTRLCGIGEVYPELVSRFWRTIIVLMGPIVIYLQVYAYHKYQYLTTLDMIDHGFPLGYLSMFGGFEKSRRNFMPILGGPFCLLGGYYIAGILFIILPRHLDEILFDGCVNYVFYQELSPLFYGMTTIERHTHVAVKDIACGYRRSLVLIRTMFYLIFNTSFWWSVFKQQIQRYKRLVRVGTRWITRIAIIILLAPLYATVCVLECSVTVVYYGIPFVSALCIAITGYAVWLNEALISYSFRRDRTVCRLIRYMFMFVIACLFLYFVVSIFTLVTLSFAFLGKIVVFCLIAVIVYPSTSFGYLFFGIVFIYYIIKTIVGFGDGYLELLAEAVEISSEMEKGLYANQVIDNVLIIDESMPSDFTRIQVGDSIINLSSVQRRAIHDASRASRKPKLKQKLHYYGIPRDLFNIIVQKHRPVYIEVMHAIMKIGFIMALIAITASIVQFQYSGPSEGISDMMHVVFIIVVGALPRILEIAMDGVNHNVSKEIHLQKLRTTIQQYWSSADNINVNS